MEHLTLYVSLVVSVMSLLIAIATWVMVIKIKNLQSEKNHEAIINSIKEMRLKLIEEIFFDVEQKGYYHLLKDMFDSMNGLEEELIRKGFVIIKNQYPHSCVRIEKKKD